MPTSTSDRPRCSRTSSRRVVRVWLVAIALLTTVPAAYAESCGSSTLRAQDSLWLISSRGVGNCAPAEAADALKYWRYSAEHSWTRSDLAQLLATDDPRCVTVVFMHGNRVSSQEAFSKGWSAYRRLVQCADEKPVRFVVWSWPSDRECGPIQDARIKAARADVQAFYLGSWIARLSPGVRVGVWGHSYGARIATGALHLLAGGTLAGRSLKIDPQAHRRMQAALVAAAVDSDWLLPGRRQGRALALLEGLLLLNNPADRLLARYHMLYGRHSPQRALGSIGLAVRRLPTELRQKITQVNSSGYVGNQHLFANYLASSRLMARIRAHLLFEHETEPLVEAPASGARTATSQAAPDAESTSATEVIEIVQG